MNKYYPHLLSPLRIGNVVLKNRMICPPSKPHFIQGDENFPSEQLIEHYAGRARSGAAVVTVDGNHASGPNEDFHMACWNLNNATTQHYVSQLVDAIHYYNSKAHHVVMCMGPWGYDVSEGIESHYVVGDGSKPRYDSKELTTEMIYKIIEDEAQLCKVAKEQCGFDGTYIHMAYRGVLPGRFLSPLTNKRTDEFGGSFENRIRFAKLLCSRIKELCGPDFLIDAAVSGHDPVDMEGGVTIEDTIAFAKQMEGLIDILTIRAPHIDPQHPTGYIESHTPWLYMAEQIKKADLNMMIAASGGFFYPEDCEAALAEGKADLLSMARAFISNDDYAGKIGSGRRDELVPCIRCNKCHRSSNRDPWLSMCSVNPTWALDTRAKALAAPSSGGRKVAIVGGGITGMEAALVSASRGNRITIFEKTDRLGGELNHVDGVSFKWPLKDFRDHMIQKMLNDPAIEIRFGCEPTPESLNEEGFDVVLAAVGAKNVVPAIDGVDGKNVTFATDVYGHEDTLGSSVVVVGGGDIGVETGLHLAQLGHKVTVIAKHDMLAEESWRVHYYTMFIGACENEPNFSCVLNAVCTGIDESGVTYELKDGKQERIDCDSVVLAVGQKPDIDAAMRYASAGEMFRLMGNCQKVGSVMSCMRAGYDTATSF